MEPLEERMRKAREELGLPPLPDESPIDSLEESAAPIPKEASSLQRALFVLVVFLYIVSLLMPALLFERREPVRGLQILFWGWWGLLAGSIAWYANPLIFISMRSFNKGYFSKAFLLALPALILASTSPFAKEWWFSEAAGTKIISLGSGFYVWLASIILLLLACVLPSRKSHVA